MSTVDIAKRYTKLQKELDDYKEKDKQKFEGWSPDFGKIFENPYAAVEYDYFIATIKDAKVTFEPRPGEFRAEGLCEGDIVTNCETGEVFEMCKDNVAVALSRQSEIGIDAINQLRDAVFAIQDELAAKPSGSRLSSFLTFAERLDAITEDNGELDIEAYRKVFENDKDLCIFNDNVKPVVFKDLMKDHDDKMTAVRTGDQPVTTGGDLILTPGIGINSIAVDLGVGKSKSVVTIVSPDGVTCSKCNDFNEYCTLPSEADGSHVCYKCKKGY